MSRVNKTILEQMRISDAEIEDRMGLLGLNADNLNQLVKYKSLIEEHIDLIVDEFYERQTSIDEIALLIGDSDTLQRLRTAQRKYIIDLFSGVYDAEYVNNRLRIGMVHKRIGVEPKLYLSAIQSLKTLIFGILTTNGNRKDDIEATLQTLDRLLYFDTTLMFDTYIESLVGEIENAKKRTEAYAKSLEKKVAERTHQLERLAKLDPLTNIYNRREMQDVLRRELAVAKRRKTRLSIAYFDIDKFKQINDKHGHIKGDEVLKYIGHILLNDIRESDIPCRYGGDEFCVILPECDIENATKVCKKIIKIFIQKYPDFSLSIGIAETGSESFADVDVLIRNADEMMYKAKKTAGCKICY